MFCKNCGSPVNDGDRVCKNCGSLTEYGEKLSRHEAVPPVENGAVRPDGSLNPDAYGKNSAGQDGGNFNDVFGSNQGGPTGGYQPPYSAQNTQNSYGQQSSEQGSAQGGYYYNPQNAQYREQPEAGGSNGFAIAGFICSFFVALLGLIFSIIGLNKSKNLGGSGKGLAIAGIVISIVSWILNFILMQQFLGDLFGAYAVMQFFAGIPLL